MKYRMLGRTGLKVSELGFGCGNVGGLMVRGDRETRARAAARAVELGVNFFDTAPLYGNLMSETHLGQALEELGADVVVGTKVRLSAADVERIEEAVVESVEGSLKRLRRDRVDLIQLHNQIVTQRQPERGGVGVHDVEAVLRAFQSLQAQGKVRYWGITGLGDTEVVHQVIDAGGMYTVQTCFNLINPTAGVQAPPGYPFQDYGQLIDRAAAQQMGVIVIRALAAGALSGTADRHPVAAPSVGPIGSGTDYGEDVARAGDLRFLVQEGYAASLVEAAIRFALSKAEVSTTLVGLSSLAQLEQAVEHAGKGPLPGEALERLREAWAGW
jgi:aryl-alcohol dehydrogenase-like predicted oxidoreductase